MTHWTSIDEHFLDVTDPRVERTKLHPLRNIMTIGLCGVICGAESWTEIAEFGRAKQAWFGQFLDLENGIPSHDTFGRVFAALNPAEFETAFVSLVQTTVAKSDGQVVAIDGKTVRRSHDRANGKAALQLVSAWASDNHVVVGQTAVDAGSSETATIPKLLELLVLKGCIVTIDAAGTHPAIARTVLEQEGDYVLALKGNQPRLHQEVTEFLAEAHISDFAGIAHETYATLEKDHGRIERRRYWFITEPEYLAWLDPQGHWPGLRSIGMVKTERRVGNTVARQTRTYLSSLRADAKTFAKAVRGHWSIENQFHWLLDVAFREDESRVRTEHAAHNFAIMRRLALQLLRKDTSAKIGIKGKRLKAGWDEAYLINVLSK